MKRVIETIDIFIKSNRLNAVLVIIGPESKELSMKECEDFIKNKSSGNIILTGPIFGEARNDWLRLADGFISLSHRENFNFAASEALKIGLPVILSPGNDISIDLKYLDVGWLIESITETHEIKAIEQFCDADKEALLHMGNNGKVWASSNLTFNNFSNKIEELLN